MHCGVLLRSLQASLSAFQKRKHVQRLGSRNILLTRIPHLRPQEVLNLSKNWGKEKHEMWLLTFSIVLRVHVIVSKHIRLEITQHWDGRPQTRQNFWLLSAALLMALLGHVTSYSLFKSCLFGPLLQLLVVWGCLGRVVLTSLMAHQHFIFFWEPFKQLSTDIVWHEVLQCKSLHVVFASIQLMCVCFYLCRFESTDELGICFHLQPMKRWLHAGYMKLTNNVQEQRKPGTICCKHYSR